MIPVNDKLTVVQYETLVKWYRVFDKNLTDKSCEEMGWWNLSSEKRDEIRKLAR